MVRVYYQVCPHCGSNLDPGEVCDCSREQGKERIAGSDEQNGASARGPVCSSAEGIENRKGNREICGGLQQRD